MSTCHVATSSCLSLSDHMLTTWYLLTYSPHLSAPHHFLHSVTPLRQTCIPLPPATLPSPKPSTTTPSPAQPLPHPPTRSTITPISSRGQGASQGTQQQMRGEGESSSRFESTPVGGKAARHRKPQRA
ncbi:unnamed protein product [Closterium sp. Naga37s-1]|nr:unnamed protein product [Closterium sp. Naga37s-1]